MCSCPAHRQLVDCTCNCDHTTDRLLQWKARAERAEEELAEARADVEIGDEKIGELNGITVRLEKRAAHWKGRNEQAEAAVERVRDLCHQPYTAAYDLAADVLAEPPCRPGNAPESNADAPTPVSAATEAHGETTEAQGGSR